MVGPADHGKSTIVRILTAYACRLDRTPILVDLDVGQGTIVPGCVSAIPLDKTCLNVEEGFSNYNPLVHFYGHTTPKDNVEIYKLLLNNLVEKINSRFEKDADAKSSGLIINTCGWIEAAGFDLLLHIMKLFAIDVALVMGHDKLYSNLASSVDGAGTRVIIVRLPRSGGTVNRVSNISDSVLLLCSYISIDYFPFTY